MGLLLAAPDVVFLPPKLVRAEKQVEIARRVLTTANTAAKLKLSTNQHDREIARSRAEAKLTAIDVELLFAQIEQERRLAPFAGVVRYSDGERSEVLSGLVTTKPHTASVSTSLPSPPPFRLSDCVFGWQPPRWSGRTVGNTTQCR